MDSEHSVALVDDHHLVRIGLAAMVNGIGGYRVTIEAGNGREFLEQLRTDAPPLIAIIDLNMPVMDGYATIAWLRQHHPEILPLVLTFDATDDAMGRAVRAGARGFILKNARPAELKIALDALVTTGYYYTEQTQLFMLQHPGLKADPGRERESVLARISQREMEFLLHVCSPEEHTYEDIARLMGVHRRTVDNYRMCLFDKLSLRSKTGLVLFALRWGLIPGSK